MEQPRNLYNLYDEKLIAVFEQSTVEKFREAFGPKPTTIDLSPRGAIENKCKDGEDCYITSGSFIPFIGEEYEDKDGNPRRVVLFEEDALTLGELINKLYPGQLPV